MGLNLGLNLGLGGQAPAPVVLESFTLSTGAQLTDLGGTGGDVTGKVSSGAIGIPGSPIHGAVTTLLPASKKFDLTVVVQHTNGSSANLIISVNFLADYNDKRTGSYSASEANTGAGNTALCLVINGGKLSATGLSGDLLELQSLENTTYTGEAVYAGSAISDGVARTFVIHVDASGATALVSVDLIGTGTVIASTDTGIDSDSLGRYLTIYAEGSGSGTTTLTDCDVGFSWVEVA